METNYSIKMAQYFESMRRARKITQEAFTDDIVSVRQYRRYLNGASILSPDVVNKFLDRLGLDVRSLFYELDKERVDELDLVSEYYNAIINNDNSSATILEKKLASKTLVDYNSNLLYRHASDVHALYRGTIDDKTFISRTKSLLSLDSLIHNKHLNITEFFILSSLLRKKGFAEHQAVSEYLMKKVTETKGMTDNINKTTFLQSVFNLSKYFGMRKNNEKVLQLTSLGIKCCNEIRSYYLLDYFYYYKALAYRNLNHKTLMEEMLYRLFSMLEAENNPTKTKKFTAWVEKDFQIDYLEFIKSVGTKYMLKHDQ